MQVEPSVEPLVRQGQNRFLDDGTPSVLIGAPILEELACGPHPKGPDTAAATLRALLWTALESAQTGYQWVFAGPAHVAKAFRGKSLGGMKRSGMSARSLQQHRALFLNYTTTTGDGRYRLKRYRQFYGLLPAVVREMVYELTNPELRAACALLAELASKARKGRRKLYKTAERAARRSGQCASRWCRVVRALRMHELLDDNRPGRKWSGRWHRRPVRRFDLPRTPLTPLGKDAIRWRPAERDEAAERPVEPPSDPMRYSTCHAEQEAYKAFNLAHEPIQPDGGGGVAELTPRLVAEPLGSVAMVPPLELSSSSSAPLASPPPPAEVAPALHDGQRLRPCDARRLLREAGFNTRTAPPAFLTLCSVTLVTVGDMRRVLELEGEYMRAASYPFRWLEVIMRADGPDIRRPDWPGSYARRHHKADLRPPAGGAGRRFDGLARAPAPEVGDLADQLAERALSDAGDSLRHLELAAERLIETGYRDDNAAFIRAGAKLGALAEQRQGAEAVKRRRHAYLEAPWHGWKLAKMCAKVEAWDRKHYLEPLELAHRDGGTLEVLCPDESHARWLCEESELAQRLCEALAVIDPAAPEWRLEFRLYDGTDTSLFFVSVSGKNCEETSI